jgi:hypothetical protein
MHLTDSDRYRARQVIACELLACRTMHPKPFQTEPRQQPDSQPKEKVRPAMPDCYYDEWVPLGK